LRVARWPVRADRAALDRLIAPPSTFVWFSVSGVGRRLGVRAAQAELDHAAFAPWRIGMR